MWKPWFIHRPSQIFRRIARIFYPPKSGVVPLLTSWGGTIYADPTRNRGYAISTTGLYDLAVSEAMVRLIEPGSLVIDGGANIGYMTVLGAVATGPKGVVLAFEPHPQLFKELQRNINEVSRRNNVGTVFAHPKALGPEQTTAKLYVPVDFENNDGISSLIASETKENSSVNVGVETLDDVIGDRNVSVLKLDIEGYEPQALRGATNALVEKRIKHIIFEDHELGKGEAATMLKVMGYEIFALGWSMAGPLVQPANKGHLSKAYESANYIATLDQFELEKSFQKKGWNVLSIPSNYGFRLHV